MEHLSACVTDRMIALGIISSDDKDCYCYSVQGLLEKSLCLTLIVLLATVFHSFIEVIAFLCVFMLIRRSADGSLRKERLHRFKEGGIEICGVARFVPLTCHIPGTGKSPGSRSPKAPIHITVNATAHIRLEIRTVQFLGILFRAVWFIGVL